MAIVDLQPGRENLNLKLMVQEVINAMPGSFGILQAHFRSEDPLGITEKGNNDIVTIADTENETYWRQLLSQKFPSIKFLGEESANGLYGELKESKDLIWVVDPLDGTVNFSRKNPSYAVSVALVQKGKPLFGVIGIPERGEVYSAQERVRLKYNVSKVDELSKATLRCDWVYNPETRIKDAKILQSLGPKVRQILSGGSAVADIMDIALGRADVYFNPGLKPWDIAAVCFIVESAGGKVTDLKGKDWNVFEQDLLITNGLLHEEVLRIITDSGLFLFKP